VTNRTLTILLCTLFAPLAQADQLSATGIGVRDLEVSKKFYAEVLGLTVLRTYELGYLNEVVLGYPEGKGAVVVLMNWPNDKDRRYDGNHVKLVFDVADPAAVISKIRALGGKIDREATPSEALPGAIIGLGRDPDNYVIEVIKR
jgi:predicted enzyme related to lactoylglutathione lyase